MSKCKFEKLIEQRYDNTLNQWVNTGNYKKGELLERNSTDCGYVPPTPPTPSYDIMFSRTQYDGTYFEVKCGDSGTSLTSEIACGNSNYDTLTGNTNPATSITIGNCVTEIGDDSFKGWRWLRGNLTLPDSVTSIGSNAFSGCSLFNGTLTLSNNLKTIGEKAFARCEYFTGDLTIPDSVIEIGEYAFHACTRFNGTFKLSNNLETISIGAFDSCRNLTGDLIIPDSVTIIDLWAFHYCSGFTSLTLSQNLKEIKQGAFENCSGFTGTLNIPDSVTLIDDWTFYNCGGFTGNLTIPASVTSIGLRAFEGCSGLTSITVEAMTPPNLEKLAFDGTNDCPIYVHCDALSKYIIAKGWEAYASRLKPIESDCYPDEYLYKYVRNGAPIIVSCDEGSIITQSIAMTNLTNTQVSGVTEIEAGSCCREIGDNAFSGFTGVEKLTLSNNIEKIGSQAFYSASSNTTGVELKLPTNLKEIGESAFYHCSGFIGDLNIPDSITKINSYTFSSCSGLNGELVIPDSVTEIGNGAFSYCSGFDEIIISNSVTSIGNSAFLYCSGFNSITLSKNLTSIGDYTFYGCSKMTDITIGDEVTSIGTSAFSYCTELKTITIGDKVTSIGTGAFNFCSSLESITVEAMTPPTLAKYALDYSHDCPIYVHCDVYEEYQKADVWKDYVARLKPIESDCDENKFLYRFVRLDKTTNVGCDQGSVITQSIARTGISINQTSGVTEIQTGSCCREIGDNAFSAYTGIRKITLSDNIEKIGNSSFYRAFYRTIGSTKGVELKLPRNLQTIGNSAFSSCSGLTGSITIPDKVTSIGNYAFYSCSTLTEFIIEATTPPTLGEYVFSGTNNCPIYVPDASLNEYKTATNWSNYADRIKPMSEKP